MRSRNERSPRGILVGWLTTLLIVACADEGKPPAPATPPEEQQAQLDDGLVDEIDPALISLFEDETFEESVVLGVALVALGEADLEGAVVSPGDILFATPTETVKNLKAGDFIASAREDQPFLRKIKEITTTKAANAGGGGAAIRASTEDAPIAEVATDALTKKSIDLPRLEKDISGTVLFEESYGKVVCESCYVRMVPKLDFGFKLSWTKGVEALLATVQGTFDGKLQVSGHFDKAAKISKEVQVVSLDKRFVQTIGVLPIWEDVTISLSVGIDAEVDGKVDMATGVFANKDLKIQLGRLDGKWIFKREGPGQFAFEKVDIHTEGLANTRTFLKTRVAVKIYSLLSAWVDTQAKADINLKICPPPSIWDGKGFLSVKAGGAVESAVLNRSGEITLIEQEFPFEWTWKTPCSTPDQPADDPAALAPDALAP